MPCGTLPWTHCPAHIALDTFQSPTTHYPGHIALDTLPWTPSKALRHIALDTLPCTHCPGHFPKPYDTLPWTHCPGHIALDTFQSLTRLFARKSQNSYSSRFFRSYNVLDLLLLLLCMFLLFPNQHLICMQTFKTSYTNYDLGRLAWTSYIATFTNFISKWPLDSIDMTIGI